MKTITQKGFALVEVLLIVVALTALVGGGYWVYSQNNDNGSAQESSSEIATEETSETDQTPTTGDYTVAKAPDLLPVCDSNSFPSGVVKSSEGNKTVAFTRLEGADDYAYNVGGIVPGGNSIYAGYTNVEADLVACIESTGKEAFSVPCEVSGTKFTLVGHEYTTSIYNLHTAQKIGETVIVNAKDCPSIVTLRDNKANAIDFDNEAFEEYIQSL